MHRTLFILAVTAIGMAFMVLSGCAATKSTNFYILNSVKTAPSIDLQHSVAAGHRNVALGVGPIALPQHLDRPQIVTRLSENKVGLNEFNQWAGSLRDNLSWVLAENLSTLIQTNRIVLYPWKRSAEVDYQVAVHVNRFDVKTNGDASLVARWTISGPEGKGILLERKSHVDHSVGSGDYEAKVSAMSRVLEGLSQKIAAAINSISEKKAALP